MDDLKNQPKEIIMKIALDMDYDDIVSLCNSDPKMNKFISKNEQFWENKFKKDFNEPLNYFEYYKIKKENQKTKKENQEIKNISSFISEFLDWKFKFNSLNYDNQISLYRILISFFDPIIKNIDTFNQKRVIDTDVIYRMKGVLYEYMDMDSDDEKNDDIYDYKVFFMEYMKEYNKRNHTKYSFCIVGENWYDRMSMDDA